MRPTRLAPLLFLLFAMAGTVTPQSTPSPPPQEATSTLTVRIEGLRNAKGNIYLKLSRDSKAIETRKVEIDANTLTARTVFENLPRGAYAVSLIHDENRNEKLDTNFLGIPKEGYGFSNNPSKRMGMPKYDETTFALNQPQQAIQIHVIYW
jgi:uncharacterized protein (DUF2141 family)